MFRNPKYSHGRRDGGAGESCVREWPTLPSSPRIDSGFPRPSATFTFDAVDRVLTHGWVGVDLFFVVSGVLITGILIDTRDRPNYFRAFYTRQALRIFPIYYLALVALFIPIPFLSCITARGLSGAYVQLSAHQAWYWAYPVNVLQART